jgi:hypothetical protein
LFGFFAEDFFDAFRDVAEDFFEGAGGGVCFDAEGVYPVLKTGEP